VLKSLKVAGFKSLANIQVEFPKLTVLFGTNAAGKSNLLEAVQMLSRIGTARTLSDAFSGPIRGYPLESFEFPAGGLPELIRKPDARFSLESVLERGDEGYCYRVAVQIHTGSGGLTVQDEYLAKLGKKGQPKGRASIEQVDDQIHVRRKSKPAHPRQERPGLNHALLSDPRLGGVEYHDIEECRKEFEGWRIYYLDPRVAMRSPSAPADVDDIGVLGEHISPFLYRLRAESPKNFDAVKRTLRSLIPSVDDLNVDLDEKRGTLDIQVKQNDASFSSRIVSEGTLRVLALCAIAANPWARGLVAFEEPENGVHPRRLELIAELLTSLAIHQGRQVIVTTHSTLFCDAVLKKSRSHPTEIVLLNVRRGPTGTEIEPFNWPVDSLFKDGDLAQALTTTTEDGLFEGLLLRGLLDD
jgi:predicted ATPase